MATWQDVKALRDLKQFDRALHLANEELAKTPGHVQMKSQAEWACYGLIKGLVEKIDATVKEKKKASQNNLRQLDTFIKEYQDLKPKIPDMAASNVLHQLSKIGRHYDGFVPFIERCGPNCLRPDDFQLNNFQGKDYGSWSEKLAREAAAWIKARPDVSAERIQFVINLSRNIQENAKDPDKTWLEWALAGLLRRVGDRRAATELIVRVLKKKKREFWAWAEAARVHRDDQPELAVACFCHALRQNAEPKFLGKVHMELAELLAAVEDYGQASSEAMIAAKIYDDNQWKHPPELSKLLQSNWYDPGLKSVEPPNFYSEHSEEALSLCFDEVRESPASYLGMTEARDGKKPKPKYAIRDDGKSIERLGRRGSPLLKKLSLGDPVLLLIGIEGDRRDVLEVHSRCGGQPWDCTESSRGELRRHEKGFGFVNNVFVPPGLLGPTLPTVDEYEVKAVWNYDKTKMKDSLRAVFISPCKK